MARSLPASLLAGLALAGTPAAEAGMTGETPPARSTDQPRPRDGNVAIRQELEAARRAGSLEAYDLFLRRHPDHVLAETARRERAAIAARSGAQGRPE